MSDHQSASGRDRVLEPTVVGVPTGEDMAKGTTAKSGAVRVELAANAGGTGAIRRPCSSGHLANLFAGQNSRSDAFLCKR